MRKDVVSVEPTYYSNSTHSHLKVTIPNFDGTMDCLIVGDSTRGPTELFILPEIVHVTAGQTFTIKTQYLTAPWFLLGGSGSLRRSPSLSTFQETSGRPPSFGQN